MSLYRSNAGLSVAQQWATYVQDTIVKGNFTLSLGLRFDKQWPGGGAGRLYLMGDVFNLLNSNMGIRGYSKYDGNATYRSGVDVEQQTSYTYPFNGLWNEVLNPRIWRFGARFEF